MPTSPSHKSSGENGPVDIRFWLECVKKEDAVTREILPYRVNPKMLHPKPLKPNHTNPHSHDQMDINNDGRVTRLEKRKYRRAVRALRAAEMSLQRNELRYGRESMQIGSYTNSASKLLQNQPLSTHAVRSRYEASL